MSMYGKLCTAFYNADKQFAIDDELKLYQDVFNKGALLFEPMCGSGRLLIPLLKLGYVVHGQDESEQMLKSCEQRAVELNLNPFLSKGKIEQFSTKQKYDGVVIPLGSFQLLYPGEHAYNAIELFKNILKPDGKLVIDLFIPWEAMYEDGGSDIGVRKVQLPTGDTIEAANNTVADKMKQHLFSKTKYTKRSNGSIVAEEEEQMDLCWYYPMEIKYLLELHGYKNISMVERYLNGSDHLTVIADVGN